MENIAPHHWHHCHHEGIQMDHHRKSCFYPYQGRPTNSLCSTKENPPMLHRPTEDLLYVLQTDASQDDMGAVLYQETATKE